MSFLYIFSFVVQKMASQAWCQREKVKNKTWFVRILLTVFYRTVEVISDMVFWFIHKKREKTILPAINNLLLLESASSLARKIRTQKVSLFGNVEKFETFDSYILYCFR